MDMLDYRNNPVHKVGGAEAQVILHSVSDYGIHLVTIRTRSPRMVHADSKTHRRNSMSPVLIEEVGQDTSLLVDKNLSRNGRSSRAVPVARLLEEAPYIPAFLKNGKGMVATEPMEPEALAEANAIWLEMAEFVKNGVKRLSELGVHKQWANRPLEWFGYIDNLITADSTAWPNFLALREDAEAQPEMQHLAQAIRKCLQDVTHNKYILRPGEWHLPFILPQEKIDGDLEELKILSVARCARVSIAPFDGEANWEAEKARYERLVGTHPVHATPAEHQATPDVDTMGEYIKRMDPRHRRWQHPHEHGNFVGWRQLRKMLPGEYITSL